ncbi:SET domain-containing protein [Paenibacillus sp. MBLB4367]|uniref:SET domain-containing protein n=1 Tax=Paenibacillus sp. MBLB4367 TaxID=3384767 RepID=UPI0039080F08
MMHPDTELRYINDQIGFGVFATKFIPKGTITWALDDLDQLLEASHVHSLDERRKAPVLKYSYRNQHGQYILCWDIGKYVNHSFHANCVGTAYEIELAARDIYPGEQLTDDYGTLNVDVPFDCFPEEGTDRVRVMPDDLLRYADYWDKLAWEAFAHFNHVDQPLGHLVRSEFRRKLEAVAEHREPLDSITAIYYAGEVAIP